MLPLGQRNHSFYYSGSVRQEAWYRWGEPHGRAWHPLTSKRFASATCYARLLFVIRLLGDVLSGSMYTKQGELYSEPCLWCLLQRRGTARDLEAAQGGTLLLS